MRVLCHTLFDCTFTGVTGHFRESQLPLTTKTGLVLQTQADWNRARNQHRNWESLVQVISLRTQPMNMTRPVKRATSWHFEFDVESEGVLGSGLDSGDLDGLIGDCEGVPMVTGLDESEAITATLHAQGTNQNIWFRAINTSMENFNG
jgi:hypothetical protein